MIELKNINKTYNSKKGINTKALNDISLTFGEKGMIFILGKSGSGKSTLLNVLGGLDKYDTGSLFINNRSANDFKDKDFDSYRNTYIGFVFQEFNLIEEYNVYENILLPLHLQKKAVDNYKINMLLKELGLEKLKKRKINELSGGQKQRVAIARALIKDPQVILADEPTGNLDSETAKEVLELLKKISQEKTIIVVSHDTEAALKYADRIIELKDGKIISDKIKPVIEKKNEKCKYTPINAKLPIKHAIKLDFSIIKDKIKNFLITSILVSLALSILLVFISLSSFSSSKTHANLLEKHNEKYIYLQKGKTDDELITYMNDTDLKNIRSIIKKYDLIKNVNEEDFKEFCYKTLGIDFENDEELYYNSSSLNKINFVELNSAGLEKKIIGTMPSKKNEILITNYIADHIIKYGMDNFDDNMNASMFRASNYDEIVNNTKYIKINNKLYKITGIVLYDMQQYQLYKDKTYSDLTREEKEKIDGINQTLIYKKQYLYNNIYVLPAFFDESNFKKIAGSIINIDGYEKTLRLTTLDSNLEYYNGNGLTSVDNLKSTEIIVGINWLTNDTFNEKLLKYINDNKQSNSISDFTKEFINKYIIDNDIINKKIDIQITDANDRIVTELKNMNIAGVYLEQDDIKYGYLSSDSLKKYLKSPIEVEKVVLNIEQPNEMEKILNTYTYEGATAESIVAKTPYSFNIENSTTSLNIVKNISTYGSIIFVVFSILLIYNFINSSIIQKEKTIGILRSLGATKNDTFKIFVFEGLILALLSVVLSIITTIPIINLLNDIFVNNLHFYFKAVFFDINKFLFLFTATIIIIFISSFIPIYKLARKKPIDAIKIR